MESPSEEAFAKVRYLYDALTPKPPELLKHDRYYIREGPLLVWDENRRKKSKRYIFLLNDALLITKRDGRTKFWLRVFITLSSKSVTVENITSGFESGFRLQISTGGDGWDSGVPKVRSFVFYSDNSVDTWVEDVERCVVANRHGHGHGSHGHSASASSVSHSSSGPTFSASKTPSPGPRSPANGAQQGTQHQNFSMFTDADFVETKVNFDSGVKLGGIRSDRGDLFDTTPLPTLAPPPRSSSSFLSAPSAAPPATSANANAAAFAPPVLAAPPQPAKNPAPVAPANPNIASLEDFLGLTASKPTQPTSTPATAPTYDFFATPASQSTSTAPAQHLAPANNMAMFAPFGTTPAANHPQPTAAVAPFNPFAMPTQPAAPTSLSAAYSTSGAYGGNMGQMGHGGAHYGQTAPFGVQPQQNAFNSTANSNSGMSYMFGAPSNNTAAQPKNNQVDFF